MKAIISMQRLANIKNNFLSMHLYNLIITGMFSKICKRYTYILLLIFFFQPASIFAQTEYYVNVNTVATPPVNPVISQYILSGGVRTTFTAILDEFSGAFVVGRIERISPAPFTISLNSNFRLNQAFQIPIPLGRPVALTSAQILSAFANFNEQFLNVSGINISEIKDANNNIRLPAGTYRICFTAVDAASNYEVGINISNPILGCATFTVPPSQPVNGVIINTQIIPPAIPNIVQFITSGNVKPTLIYNNPQGSATDVKVYGKIESLSPRPFTISLDPDYFQQTSINLRPSVPFQLLPQQLYEAFGNFNESNLITTGIDINEIKDNQNVIKLPEGLYRICFYARYVTAGQQGAYASNVNLGCANFSICYKAGAPQFTQPVSNFSIQSDIPVVRLASPVIFTWTPPNATCGLNLSQINYDFEIREMFPFQNPTDAINNPPVYRKLSLLSSSFILDTLVNPGVLKRGNQYVIRVKANLPLNSSAEIDNNGFSRIQAFKYGDSSVIPVNTQAPEKIKQSITSTIVTSVIKGKVVWSFKKAEEEMPAHSGNVLTNLKEDYTQLQLDKFFENKNSEDNKQAVKQSIDPNLRIATLNYTPENYYKISNSPDAEAISGNEVSAAVSGDGTTIEKKDLNIAPENGKITHPLKNATILLMGVKVKSSSTVTTLVGAPKQNARVNIATQLGIVESAPKQPSGVNKSNIGTAKSTIASNMPPVYKMADEGDQEEDIIGSGTSDAEGNFVINFIDPKFKNVSQYSSMRLVVEHKDFEKYSQSLKVVMPDQSGDLDVGTLQVVAKTYRFTPSVSGGGIQKIELYCPLSTFLYNSHYQFINSGASVKDSKTISGRQYVKIAEGVNGETINKLFYQYSNSDNFIVQISSKGIENYSSYLGVTPLVYSVASKLSPGKNSTFDESSLVISVKKRYKILKIFPYVTGNVKLLAEDKNNSANTQLFQAEGAIVTVSYDASKVIEDYKEPAPLVNQENLPKSSTYNPGILAAPNITSSKGNIKGSAPVNPNVTNKAKSNNAKVSSTNQQTSSGTISNSIAASLKASPEISSFVKTHFRYSATTDADGNFRIDNLPVLEDGSYFTVSVTTQDNFENSRAIEKTLKRGDSDVVNFQFSPEVFTVTGIVVDDNGEPLSNAILKWKSGGNPVEAETSGLFVTSNYKDDSLTISRQGYTSKTIFIKLNKEKSKKEDKQKNKKEINNYAGAKSYTADINYDNSTINKWGVSLANQTSVKAATQGKPVAPASFGYASSTTMNINEGSLASIYKSLFTSVNQATKFNDVGKVGYLEKGNVKINFIVSDATSRAAIANAIITIDNTIDTFTNNTGEVLYKGGGNSFSYTVKGPEGSDYVIQTGEVGNKLADGNTTVINVLLSHGIKVSGKITSNSTNLAGALIYLDGKDYISTLSKADGSYVVFLPAGEAKLQVTKEGYYGEDTTKTFSANAVINFNLKDGGGKNISKLLGFDIELESYRDEGAGQKWTGSFVNLRSNSVFSSTSGTKLKFSNISVTFDASGNAVVAGNEVKTDATELSMKLFGYIPLKIQGSPQIIVRKNLNGVGSIGGKMQLNLDQVSTVGGLLFNTQIKPYLIPLNSSIDKDIPVFTSDGNFDPTTFVFSFARNELKNAADKAVADFQTKVNKATGEAKASLTLKLNELKAAALNAASYSTGVLNIPSTFPQYISIKIFGFEAVIDLAKCNINNTGLDLGGYVISPDLTIISSLVFDIDKLKIGTDFSVKDVSVFSNVNLKFNVAAWSAELNTVKFTMNGFKIGGKIEVEVPKSPKTKLDFSNLAFGTSGLYGGSFALPDAGLNVFEIINLNTGIAPLTFGEVGNSGVYKLGGSAKFAFGKLFSESIEVPYFLLQTNGKFAVTVPVNKSLNTGFAKFSLNSISFNTTTPTPQIDIDGKFSVDVQLISFSVGGIHFKKSGVTVDKIGLGIDIPGTQITGYVEIKDNGFRGGGSLAIIGTPVKAEIDFYYFNKPEGVELGAKFVASVKIPIGPVIISKIGGGFNYRASDGYFSVTITGGASVTGFETLIALDPISLTVESGPKITGEVGVKVASSLDIATASIVIDIPNSYFAIGIVAGIEPLPDIVRAHIQGDLIVSTKTGDSYFFLGAGIDVNLLGLINSRGVFALGFGVGNAQTRPTISYYMKDAPSAYLSNGTFSGVYLNAMSEMGITKENAPEVDLIVASGKLWLYSRSDFTFIANFVNPSFRVSSSMYFEGGIKACLVKICASASAKACVDISGGYNNSEGWNFAARASGEGILSIGSNCGCNDICVGLIYAGGKICVGAGAKIRYASKQGGLTELNMYIGNRATCNPN